MSNSNKFFWISAANVFACLGVIILHCNSIFWSFPKGFTWYTANFLETFFYWPVPVFFMISGATSINYRERYSTGTFLVKRFKRTLIPFFFWSIVAMLFRIKFYGYETNSIKDVISGIFNTNYFSIYWFFIPLFAIYLSMPMLSAVSKEYRTKVFGYIVLMTFIFTSLFPTLFSLLQLNYNKDIQPPVAGGYVLYVLVGYLIANTDLTKKQRFAAYAISFLGWFLHFQGTTMVSFKAGEIIGTYKGYMNFPAVMHSIGIFILFKYFPWHKILGTRGIQLIQSLAKYTFGIYLMHFYFVLGIPEITKLNVGDLKWRTFGALLIFILCALLSSIISRIPFFKLLIGS